MRMWYSPVIASRAVQNGGLVSAARFPDLHSPQPLE
jgi:hypothetical protein